MVKPCSSISIDGFEASPTVKALSFNVSFTGWRFANLNFKSWATNMAISYKPIWLKAGIFEAVMASTATIHKDIDLVLSFAEKWCPKTNTFVFPWGETTITLEDVMVLLDFSVLGSPVFAGLDSEGEKIKAKLVKEYSKIVKDRKLCCVTQAAWMKRFDGCGDELEHVAFLVVWLCYFVFPFNDYHIYKGVFHIAVHLSRGTRIALAPAVLAHLYAELSILKSHIRAFTVSKDIERNALRGLFKLVQVWAWERFKELQPVPNELVKGEPRLALWHNLHHRASEVSRILDNSRLDSFEWRPYTKTVENWEFPKFYPENDMLVHVGSNLDDEFVSFARCIKVSDLVGIDYVEHYYPNRVASQFGIVQDVPGPVKRNKLSQEEAWNDYSKDIDDSTLYIPSRYATGCDTPVSFQWWRKSLSESNCSSEVNLVVESDDTDFVPSSSIKNRTSEDARKIAENFRNKRRKYMKRACKQVAVDNDEDNGSLDVAQKMRLRSNKYSDVRNSRRDSSDSDEAINIVVSPPEKKKTCEDELEVLSDNVEEDDDDVDGDSLIQKKLAVEEFASKEHNNEPTPRQKLAYRDATNKAYTSMVLSLHDESNINIAIRDKTQEHDCLLHDNAIGSEETRKTNEPKDMEQRNGVGKDNLGTESTYQKSLHKLERLESTIEELFIKANENLAFLKN